MFGTTKHHRTAYGGRDPHWWPLLLLLLTVVLLPTACLLWLMTKAIDNERLAVRQILAETCRGQLVRLRSQWDEHWQTRAQARPGGGWKSSAGRLRRHRGAETGHKRGLLRRSGPRHLSDPARATTGGRAARPRRLGQPGRVGTRGPKAPGGRESLCCDRRTASSANVAARRSWPRPAQSPKRAGTTRPCRS